MKETFISPRTPSHSFSDKLASAINRRRLNPDHKRRKAQRMKRLASNCGDKNEDLTKAQVRSEMGFDDKMVDSPSKSSRNCGKYSQTTQSGCDQQGKLRLILPDPTAIGMGLRHASRAPLSHAGGAAHSSVTRGQPTLRPETSPGNWGQFPIGEDLWNESSPKRHPEHASGRRLRMGPRPIRLLVR